MTNKKGESRGRGQGGGKRQATTPVGDVYKDSRKSIYGDEKYDEENEWTQVIYNTPKSPAYQTKSGPTPNTELSYTGAASRAISKQQNPQTNSQNKEQSIQISKNR